MKFSIEWYIIVGVLFDYDRKSLLRKWGWVDLSIGKVQGKMSIFAITPEGFGQSFSSSSLDRDIVKTELCRKFHRDLTLLSKVIV